LETQTQRFVLLGRERIAVKVIQVWVKYVPPFADRVCISGGPLFIEHDSFFTQLGIVSYGYGCATHLPGVYTRLEMYTDWVRDVLKQENNEESFKASARTNSMSAILIVLHLILYSLSQFELV
jgi:hypothetical protein